MILFFRYIWVLLLVPVLFCLYLVVLFGLIRFGEQLDVRESDNAVLELASRIAYWDVPDLHVALARYDRERASLGQDVALQRQWLESSRHHWDMASQLRPLWPYYQLGAFNAEVTLGSSTEVIQARFDQVAVLSKNERGADRSLFELGFAVWPQLRRDQQDWLVGRMVSSVWPQTVAFAFEKAELHDVKGVVCIRLPWSFAQKHCKQKGTWLKQSRSLF